MDLDCCACAAQARSRVVARSVCCPTSRGSEPMRVTRAWSVSKTIRSALAAATLIAAPAVAQAQQATISGKITAAGTAQPLVEARVQVVGQSIVGSASADGRYTLRGVPPGTVDIRVIRVGYVEQKKSVTVPPGGTVTLDFTMETAIVKLQEVVTTATGEQRKVELGNTVAVIDVARRVEETPINSMNDLLVAKAPGVAVLPGNMTGAGAQIRIRGLNSVTRSNAPIYIIDGVRMDGGTGNISVGGTSSSRLGDLSPDEIESIEIVKGPSAATLYGTDAANGGIVITRKKGRAGNARWNWSVEQGVVSDRNDYGTSYAIWGHAPTAPSTAVRCYLQSMDYATPCVQDSVTSINILRDDYLTPIHLGKRSSYGGQVSGGSELF